MIFVPDNLDEYFIIQFPVDFLVFETEIRPFEYLEFARLDLSDGNEPRNLINALGNAKRALHLQVETIANGYGYRKLSRSSKFPPKLDFLGEIGITTPAIISKLNTLRNKVEHDYLVPDLEQIQDYCDVVELFLRATEAPINTFPVGVEFESNESFDRLETKLPRKSLLPEMLTIDVTKFEGEIRISGSDIDRSNDFEQIITTADTEYSKWIKQILKHVFRRI